ncbi:DUF2971 domain-containing protein [Leisingera aquaemixtae]|uniref:DUF2971 domain-containing protein n=1 Tax=Leisingera aquaemixtae TaxID=1396826 RepID=UPI00398420D9
MRLYKFYGAESAVRNIRDKRLKVSTIKDLNDPFEFHALRLPNKASRAVWSHGIEEVFSQVGIICFCKHWHNPVIWSHYADSHRGLALGFDVEDKGGLLEVEYTKKRIDFAEEANNNYGGDVMAFIKKSISTKFMHWVYEDEVRLVCLLDNKDEQSSLYFQNFGEELALKEVIIGARSQLSSMDVRNAFGANEDLSITTARLAFQDFRVVKQHALSRQR